MPEFIYNGKTVHYRETGQGPVLLFIHEWNGNSSMINARGLRPLGRHFRVIAPDLPGFGSSEPMEKLGMDELSLLMKELLRHLGIDKVYAGGFCMGTILALDFSIRNPELVEGLVLMEPILRFPPVLKLLSIPYIGSLILRFMLHSLPGLLGFFLKTANRPVKALRRMSSVFGRVDVSQSLRYLQVLSEYDRTDHIPRISRLDVPVFCIHGGNTLKEVRDTAAVLSGIFGVRGFTSIPGARHYFILENPLMVELWIGKVADNLALNRTIERQAYHKRPGRVMPA